MTFKDRAKTAWNILTKASAAQSVIARYYGAGGSAWNWTQTNYQSLVRGGFGRTADVYAAITTILIAGRQVCIDLYQGTGDDNEELTATNHPLAQLIRQPNPSQSKGDFAEYVIGYLLCSGNAYVEAVRTQENKPPVELYVQRPDLITIYPSSDPSSRSGIDHYNLAGSNVNWTPENMGHAKFFNPLDPWYGFSPLEAALYSIDTLRELKQVQNTQFRNSGRPPGILVSKTGPNAAPLTDDQHRDFRNAFQDSYKASAQTGTPMVLQGEFSWLGQAFSPEQMQAIELYRLEKNDIAAIFHVPPELIGETERKTYANYAEARKGLYTEAVLPVYDLYCGLLNLWLCPQFGENLFFAVDRDSIDALQEDRDKAWTRVFGAVDRGIITRNEARGAIGYAQYIAPSRDPADQLTVGAANVLLDELAMPAAPLPPDVAPVPVPPQRVNGQARTQ
jgi:HK97 family phage portal protein